MSFKITEKLIEVGPQYKATTYIQFNQEEWEQFLKTFEEAIITEWLSDNIKHNCNE